MRIHRFFENTPDEALAIVDYNNSSLSYRALRQQIDELYDIFLETGLCAGDRLALITENCALYVATVLACSKLDVWFVLINARQTNDEVDAILTHSNSKFILFTTDASDKAKDHAERLGGQKVATLDCGEIVLSKSRDTEKESVDQSANQTAALLYTTGTTSTPKAVMLSHKNLLFNASASGRANNITPKDRVLLVLPGTHIFGLATVFLQTMLAGATLQIMRRFEVEKVVEALESGVTVFQGVPQMFTAIVNYLATEKRSFDASNLKVISAGGAPLDPALKKNVEAIFGLNLNNGYGISETAAGVCTTDRNIHRDDTSVGPAIDGVSLKIDNPNEEGIGEVWVSGDNVMNGYYRAPELTKAALTDDGYFKTGDLARMDADGSLHIVGRSKELIIRAGFNIYPPEVEAMLSKHPSISQASVIGRRYGDDEEIIAFIQLRKAISETAIKDWLRERLVGYKIPQRIIVVDHYPSAATGKILKHKLVSHFANEITLHENKSG
ncbi:MAG: class I adenylate-forming enzyme family protein [Hyphomicrobiales bacterium]